MILRESVVLMSILLRGLSCLAVEAEPGRIFKGTVFVRALIDGPGSQPIDKENRTLCAVRALIRT